MIIYDIKVSLFTRSVLIIYLILAQVRGWTSTNNPKQAKEQKSNKHHQAVGPSTEHKQPQASTSKHTAEWAQMRWNKYENRQEWGEWSQLWQAQCDRVT